jgi:DNA-binding MurR/RpiR family transcriptional regulator
LLKVVALRDSAQVGANAIATAKKPPAKNPPAKKVEVPSVPTTFSLLRAAIAGRYDILSKRMQQVARFVLEHPNNVAIETVAVVARRAGAQPSTVVRFANTFGYSGFSEMQRVFQSSLLSDVPSYTERVRQSQLLDETTTESDPKMILQEFCGANVASLRHLENVISAEALSRAVALIEKANVVHVVGVRRSFPVAAYLSYALSLAERRTHLLTGLGGQLPEQAKLSAMGDVLIAVSTHPYADETVSVVEAMAARGIPVIAITDSVLSPISRHAKVSFEVHDAELRGFRSQTAALCLAQSLVISVAMQRAPTPSTASKREPH